MGESRDRWTKRERSLNIAYGDGIWARSAGFRPLRRSSIPWLDACHGTLLSGRQSPRREDPWHPNSTKMFLDDEGSGINTVVRSGPIDPTSSGPVYRSNRSKRINAPVTHARTPARVRRGRRGGSDLEHRVVCHISHVILVDTRTSTPSGSHGRERLTLRIAPDGTLARALRRWSWCNLAFEALSHVGTPTVDVRYEDLVNLPGATLHRIAEAAGVMVSNDHLLFVGDGEVRTGDPTHRRREPGTDGDRIDTAHHRRCMDALVPCTGPSHRRALTWPVGPTLRLRIDALAIASPRTCSRAPAP
jgi:hypothetical protein